MNRSAQQHLTKAKDYVAKGEEFYRKAAAEFVAAKEADSTLTNARIADEVGQSESWVQHLVTWRKGDHDGPRFSSSDDKNVKYGAKKFLRNAPPEQVAEIVAELEPAARQKVYRAFGAKQAEQQTARERVADDKLREKIGDDTVDDLEFAEKLKSTEYLLISARGNLRGFVRHAGEIGIDNAPSNWRESCLDWIEDLEGHLGMARALLAGDNIDWSAFEDMLEQEGR